MNSAIVLGAGSWGTALCSVLAERGLDVQFWGRDAALMEEIRTTRRNSRYLEHLELPASVRPVSDMQDLDPAAMLVFVVPSKGMRETARLALEAGLAANQPVVVSCTKGIELDTGLRMSQILGEQMPGSIMTVLTGPNHAEEVAQHQPTAAVVACEEPETAAQLQGCFTLPWFRTYTTDDITGAEWGGALKNPYAIAAGIARGLRLGDNAIAALVTRSLAEMVRLGIAEGGRAETFYGLSGVGDLVATCYSEHSRNHRVGMALGRGQTLTEILAGTRMIAEGVPNTESLYRAARAKGVRTPLLDEIYAVLYESKPARDAMRALLSRDPRPESE